VIKGVVIGEVVDKYTHSNVIVFAWKLLCHRLPTNRVNLCTRRVVVGVSLFGIFGGRGTPIICKVLNDKFYMLQKM
jgi:hypothetical protein